MMYLKNDEVKLFELFNDLKKHKITLNQVKTTLKIEKICAEIILSK